MNSEYKNRTLKNISGFAYLWIAAIIWGFAFVAQRKGMETMGPFYFNVFRFLLGAATVLAVICIRSGIKSISKSDFKMGIYAGLALFIASTLQQTGIVYTGAGKAGFISGTYIAFVPLLGLALGHKVSRKKWIGILVVLIGLMMLTYQKGFRLEKGDILLFLSAICWSVHIHVIDKYIKKVQALNLAFVQFLIAGLLSLVPAMIFEDVTLSTMQSTLIPLLYAGILSVGIAYTLQVVGQKLVEPSLAALVMSFETVFALVGGWLVLHEQFALKEILGCLVMFAGMLIVQINFQQRKVNKIL